MWHRTSVSCVLLALAACGARTGLRAPDASSIDLPTDVGLREDMTDVTVVGMDTSDAQDAPDAGLDACAPRSQELRTRAATVLLVLDRSGSMSRRLADGRTRAQALQEALARALPAYQADVRVGALSFPNRGSCEVRGPVEIAPDFNTAERIAAFYLRASTIEGTPTFDALALAATELASVREGTRHVVLATDGSPSCNTALDPATCACPDLSGMPCEARFCLDDRRTLAALERSAAMGVPTWVVGIDDTREPVLVDTLNRMAVAGGRPRTGEPRYFSAREPAALDEAFVAIRRSITACSRELPAPVADLGRLVVRRDGAVIARDASRQDGWDVTTPDGRELTFFGAACDRVASGGRVTFEVDCRP